MKLYNTGDAKYITATSGGRIERPFKKENGQHHKFVEVALLFNRRKMSEDACGRRGTLFPAHEYDKLVGEAAPLRRAHNFEDSGCFLL